jgi:hypothetical protein
MRLISRLRSWPLIVGAFIVVFGIGVGVGVALAHGTSSAAPTTAQLGRIRVHQQVLDAAKAAQVAQLAQRHAQRMQQIADQQRLLAVRAERIAALDAVQRDQQQASIQECDTMYSVPAKTDPTWAASSALQASCLAAASNGIAPAEFRSKRDP